MQLDAAADAPPCFVRGGVFFWLHDVQQNDIIGQYENMGVL